MWKGKQRDVPQMKGRKSWLEEVGVVNVKTRRLKVCMGCGQFLTVNSSLHRSPGHELHIGVCAIPMLPLCSPQFLPTDQRPEVKVSW